MRDNTVLAHWQNISLCPYSEVISVHEHGLYSRDTRPGQAVPHFSRLVASTIASDTESWLMIMLMMFFEHLSSLSPLVNRGRGVLVLGSLATLCFTFEQFMQYGRQNNLSWFALTLLIIVNTISIRPITPPLVALFRVFRLDYYSQSSIKRQRRSAALRSVKSCV